LNECPAACSARARGAVDAVQQLADGDHADCARLVAGSRVRSFLAALDRDEDIGDDQDGQGSSGAATARRISVRSRANSSSIGGAEAISAWNRSAERKRAWGVPITATGAPARVISISSPSSTRLSRSEKERAASVALSRATSAVYLINQRMSVEGAAAGKPLHRLAGHAANLVEVPVVMEE